MSTYNNIDHELELKIRRGFSSDLKKFKAMKGWLDGAFKQMIIHNEYSMYSFRSRVKQVESLLKKFDEKVGDELSAQNLEKIWKEITSYNGLVNEIDDFIGGRLISYFIDDIPKLHNYLVEFERFDIVEVTIHDMITNHVLLRPILKSLNIIDNDADFMLDSLDKGNRKIDFNVSCSVNHQHSSSDSKKIPYQIRLNSNGYVGVHMIIKPLTYDDYWKNEPGLFGKFELQVRSLIHEAWAEIQHKVTYKGQRMPEEVKNAKASHLEGISTILSGCEKALFSAAQKSGKGDTGKGDATL